MIGLSRRQGRRLRIWTTRKCTVGCEYCDSFLSDSADMDEETLETTASWVNANRVGTLSWFGGEPLEYPHGIKYLTARTNVPNYSMTTNGLKLTDDLYDWFRLFKFTFALSFDGSREAHDKYRGGTYDAIMKQIPRWLELNPNLNVLCTLADPFLVYEQVKNIKEAGFKRMYLNILHPYGYGYTEEQLKVFEGEYRRVIKDFHRPPSFSLGCFESTLQNAKVKEGLAPSQYQFCGICNMGLGVDVDGLLYPCDRAMEMGEDFAIGSVFHGIDPVREKRIRNMMKAIPQKCVDCPTGCIPCKVQSWNAMKTLDAEPDEYHCVAMKVRYKVAKELAHLSRANRNRISAHARAL